MPEATSWISKKLWFIVTLMKMKMKSLTLDLHASLVFVAVNQFPILGSSTIAVMDVNLSGSA
jgi:hypothetical protein